jgi:hypothetical protein
MDDKTEIGIILFEGRGQSHKLKMESSVKKLEKQRINPFLEPPEEMQHSQQVSFTHKTHFGLLISRTVR